MIEHQYPKSTDEIVSSLESQRDDAWATYQDSGFSDTTAYLRYLSLTNDIRQNAASYFHQLPE